MSARLNSYSAAAKALTALFPERRTSVFFDAKNDGLTVAISEVANDDPDRIIRAWMVNLKPRVGLTRPQLFCRWAQRELHTRDSQLRELLFAHAAQEDGVWS